MTGDADNGHERWMVGCGGSDAGQRQEVGGQAGEGGDGSLGRAQQVVQLLAARHGSTLHKYHVVIGKYILD